MKVSIINKIVEHYTKHLHTDEELLDPLYEYPSRWLKQKDNSDRLALKLFETFKSERTQRLWKRERYRPLETLALFNEYASEETSEALDLLLNSQSALEDRIDLFKFMSEEILIQLKKENHHNNFADTNWDVQWISLILSATRPQIYPFYHRSLFFSGAKALEMSPQPQIDDYPRYLKMINIIETFLRKTDTSSLRLKQRSLKLSNQNGNSEIIKNNAVEALALYLRIDIYDTPQ